jgi:hypothetical protein
MAELATWQGGKVAEIRTAEAKVAKAEARLSKYAVRRAVESALKAVGVRPELLTAAVAMLVQQWRPVAASPQGDTDELGPVYVMGPGGAGATVHEAALAWAATPEAAAFLTRPSGEPPRGPAWAAIASTLKH